MRGRMGNVVEYINLIPLDGQFLRKDLARPIPPSVLHRMQEDGWIRKTERYGKSGDTWQ